ncbi:hypothetical protein [Streptomyces sp. cmx-18-6]|uniref:hypothetical protein n=1 Tax=Streptomyces sp. cmx-18-6 TaxID=2790930 RepID=UPI0039810299
MAMAAAILGGSAAPSIAAPAPAAGTASVVEPAKSFGTICKKKSRNHILKKYYRGPAAYTLRCGTAKWGWKHIKARHGWNATMDKKINAAIWSGRANGRGGFSTYTASCPSKEKFRTIIGTPAARNDLLTAYKVNSGSYVPAC